VDKGANAPNLFVDDKSSESALPPFSTGARDDLIQRLTLEAYLRHWDAAQGGANPLSSITGRPMIEDVFAWCWDARPHPAFPARADVWADGAAWRRGHWLNGRAGLSGLGEVVLDLCRRAGVDDADASRLLGVVSGYVVDSPASARAALEPLMAVYDFDAAERAGRIVFFHRDEGEQLRIGAGELTARSASEARAQRGDAAETPIEARVRFLDAARDYRIAGVNARRLDRAEGGVETIEAPLVLEAEAAEALALRTLIDRRAAAESMRAELGHAHLAIEPGDRIAFEDGEPFEVVRIEDGESRLLELRRARTAPSALLGAAAPGAQPIPALASTPAFSILDLPPLPGAESEERPLAAVFAAPWLGAHDIFAGAPATRRGVVAQAAIMGELLSPLWPGPVDRWDDGAIVRVRLFGGTLVSVERDAVLGGANAFAIESDGEWEIVQARDCELVGAGEYLLSGLLRGQLGSAHAMRVPHPAGARIVKLDERLARIDVGSHEWKEAVAFAAPPAGAPEGDARSARVTLVLPNAALRPWAPAHLRARRAASGDLELSWVRCARAGGDFWGAGEPPLGVPDEAYLVEILDAGGGVRRTVAVATPAHVYAAAEQIADFGGFPPSLRVRVAQLDAAGAPGLKKELTITL
jgi:hypothetical protein